MNTSVSRKDEPYLFHRVQLILQRCHDTPTGRGSLCQHAQAVIDASRQCRVRLGPAFPVDICLQSSAGRLQGTTPDDCRFVNAASSYRAACWRAQLRAALIWYTLSAHIGAKNATIVSTQRAQDPEIFLKCITYCKTVKPKRSANRSQSPVAVWHVALYTTCAGLAANLDEDALQQLMVARHLRLQFG